MSRAVHWFREALTLRPDDPDPYYGLAQALKGLGDNSGAITAFRKYIEMEKRPGEQKWVEKARQELAALEALQRSTAAPGDAGKIEEKSAVDGMGGRSPDDLMPFPATPPTRSRAGRPRCC